MTRRTVVAIAVWLVIWFVVATLVGGAIGHLVVDRAVIGAIGR